MQTFNWTTRPIKKSMAKITAIEDRLPTLPESERKTLTELLDAYDEIVGIIGEASFLQGFQLGGRMTASMLLA